MNTSGTFTSYTFGEGRTAIGQAIEFTCRSESIESIKAFLHANIRTISPPVTSRTKNIEHGGYGRYTRYDIVQHKYAGGGGGYIEVLEIKDPPQGRWGIVINEHNPYGSAFTEWKTLKNALDAFEACWPRPDWTKEQFPNLQGFQRRVHLGPLTPWFYAIGDEELVGDYAFPDGFQDDPVFRFGRKFIVLERDAFDGDLPIVKTCMGTRLITRKTHDYPYKEYQSRIVYWNDGAFWDEESPVPAPKPLGDNEMWVAEAIAKFERLLSGQTEYFSINFTDGSKFVGKVVRPKLRTSCPEGDYFLVVHLKGEKKPQKGWVNGFKPTTEDPGILQFVTHGFRKAGREVERVEIKKRRVSKGGKKWSGVFFSPPSAEKP